MGFIIEVVFGFEYTSFAKDSAHNATSTFQSFNI
jgi:hypothetical protein